MEFKLTNSKHGGGHLNKTQASSKRYLIVFGIFALVIVTTAVSYAFFTYSRVGETTTTVTSGDIEFSFIEGTNAYLTDAFPVADSVGANDASGEYTFDVKMSSSSTNNKMSYNVYLLDDNNETHGTSYFNNEQIEFALIKNGTYVAGTSSTNGKKLTEVTGFTAGEHTGEGLVLENQEIIANSKDSYKLRIWISDDVNYSNEIDSNGTMTGKFNGYKYSLKVKVTSGVETSTTVSEPVGRVIVANLADSNGISAYAVTTSSDPTTVTEWIDVTSDETAKSNVVRTATSVLQGTSGKVTSKTIQHKVNDYGTYYLHVKNILNEITTKKVEVKIKEVSRDTSGAAAPVITGNLLPVILNGSDVIKADTTKGWYNYDQAIWANAVILEDNAGTYVIGDIIPEEAIEAYFVWIPRYEYKIFNEGNYTEVLTTKGDATQEIEIRFVDKDKDAVQNGSTVGAWLTHPAFTSFDSNGMWIGKFESGYRGATSTSEAANNENDVSKLIIKPNQYSWRYNNIGNMFKVSYDYQRNLDSHMMKNTEWGAVSYLSHSKYGTNSNVRINNNERYITGYSAIEEPVEEFSATSIEGNRTERTNPGIDGIFTLNYSNIKSVVSSTTGNYSGIYDMSGCSYETVMGYNINANTIGGESGILTIYSDFFENASWEIYYDKYYSNSIFDYNKRILGDATGEMGPFIPTLNLEYRNSGSWYDDYGSFVGIQDPFFARGGNRTTGKNSGIFSFLMTNGASDNNNSFRVVLTPQE